MLTKESIEKFSTDDTAVSLVRSALVLEARADIIREKVDAYISEVFERFEFYLAPKWMERTHDDKLFGTDFPGGRIMNIEDLYLTDLKSDNYLAYCDACRDAHLANSFAHTVLEREEETGGDRGWCPALIAETEHREAEQVLSDYASDHLGFPKVTYPERKKFLDIVTTIVLQGPRGSEISLDALLESH